MHKSSPLIVFATFSRHLVSLFSFYSQILLKMINTHNSPFLALPLFFETFLGWLPPLPYPYHSSLRTQVISFYPNPKMSQFSSSQSCAYESIDYCPFC
jgi:hypothetical protein